MLGDTISKLLVQIFGFLWPAYQCFKAIEHREPGPIRDWCIYWCALTQPLTQVHARICCMDAPGKPWLTPMHSLVQGRRNLTGGEVSPSVPGQPAACRFTMAVFITAERVLDMFIFWLPLYNEVTVQARSSSCTERKRLCSYAQLFPAQSRATAHYPAHCFGCNS